MSASTRDAPHKGPPSLTLADHGVSSQRLYLRQCIETTELQLSDAESSGRASLSIRDYLFDYTVSSIELDAAACRHLAALLVRKADEIDAATTEWAS